MTPTKLRHLFQLPTSPCGQCLTSEKEKEREGGGGGGVGGREEGGEREGREERKRGRGGRSEENIVGSE